jgi:hypothetical protein
MCRPVNECFGARIFVVSFLVLIGGFTGVGAQAYLKPGFDAEEYRGGRGGLQRLSEAVVSQCHREHFSASCVGGL